MIIATPINGVLLENLPVLAASGGAVLKMLIRDDPLLPDLSAGFGELYFSEVNPGVVRAWKCHKQQAQRFTVPAGLLKLGFFDARENSPTRGIGFSILLGRPDHYRLLAIPPGVWYGFEGLAALPSLICNFATLPHDPAEIQRAPVSGPDAPADWSRLEEWSPQP